MEELLYFFFYFSSVSERALHAMKTENVCAERREPAFKGGNSSLVRERIVSLHERRGLQRGVNCALPLGPAIRE